MTPIYHIPHIKNLPAILREDALLCDAEAERRKQAEFLVHGHFPWDLVTQLGVLDTAMATDVRNVIVGAGHLPRVTIETKWYYDF